MSFVSADSTSPFGKNTVGTRLLDVTVRSANIRSPGFISVDTSRRSMRSAMWSAVSASTRPPHPCAPSRSYCSRVTTFSANNNSSVGRQFHALTWRSPRLDTRMNDIALPVFSVDTIDPTFYTDAHGHGSTTASQEPGVDVGGHTGPTTQCRASLLRTTESDPRAA